MGSVLDDIISVHMVLVQCICAQYLLSIYTGFESSRGTKLSRLLILYIQFIDCKE